MGMTVNVGGFSGDGNGNGNIKKTESTTRLVRVSSQSVRSGSGEKKESSGSEGDSGDGSGSSESDGSSGNSTETEHSIAANGKKDSRNGNRPKISSRIKLHNGRLRVSFDNEQDETPGILQQEIERFKDFLYDLGREIFTNENSNQ